MEYRQINLSIPVALYATDQAGREKELEWIKKTIQMYVCDHPDEIFDRVSISETLPLTEAEFMSREGDEPPTGWDDVEKAQHWASDPRGK